MKPLWFAMILRVLGPNVPLDFGFMIEQAVSKSFQVAASQERELIKHFVNLDSLDPYLQQALWTQATVDAIQQSIVSANRKRSARVP